MDMYLKILNYLKEKYANPTDPKKFVKEFNETINKFHMNQENIDSFDKWMNFISENLDLQFETANSTFLPSQTFFIYHEILKYPDYKIYKMEYFHISFIEEYYTSQFVTYIREEKEGEVVMYDPSGRPKRDSKFDANYNKIMEEIQKRYPDKRYMDIEFTDYIIGDYQMTYSTRPKTSIYELLFRSKNN